MRGVGRHRTSLHADRTGVPGRLTATRGRAVRRRSRAHRLKGREPRSPQRPRATTHANVGRVLEAAVKSGRDEARAWRTDIWATRAGSCTSRCWFAGSTVKMLMKMTSLASFEIVVTGSAFPLRPTLGTAAERPISRAVSSQAFD